MKASIRFCLVPKYWFTLSYEEGIPITFFEGMACGLPIVTYYLPSYAELKNLVIQVPVGNVEILAHRIESLLSDSQLMEQYSTGGLSFVYLHTWKEVAKNVVDSMIGRVDFPPDHHASTDVNTLHLDSRS